MFSWQNIIYIPESEIKCSSFCIYVAFDKLLYKHSFIVIQYIGTIGKELSTVCSHRDAAYLFPKMPFKLDKYAIYNEFHHTDYFIICV